ncbi:MAG: cysteine desulfurase, partial [Candidatus Nealsonbacteria bacterium]|nr:cysteine desulfurase [Candidatus Nealsonbacteria bacterium]
ASLAAGGTASLAAGGTASGRIVVSAIEHASVIEPAEHLMENGWRYDGLGVDGDGVIRTDALAGLLAEDTRLVSVLAANHETGVLQPIARLAEICNEAGVPLHTDAVQMAGKLPVNFREWGVAAMSVAAHKFRGPTGIGALIVRDGVAIAPLLFGGHQQGGLRPGTEPVALAVGMRTALETWQEHHREHARLMTAHRERFEAGLRAGMPEIVVHGSAADRLPQTSNIAFPGLDGQILLMALDTAGVACSVGSACSSGSTELSPTLRAMDLPSELVRSSLRFSLGSTTAEAQIDEAVGRILHVCGELQM